MNRDELMEKICAIRKNCVLSIISIDKKLENNKEPFEVIDGRIQCLNNYQICRLKAIRMKCKEILRIIGGE